MINRQCLCDEPKTVRREITIAGDQYSVKLCNRCEDDPIFSNYTFQESIS